LPTKKNIESPELLYQLFTDYKKHCKSNPIKKMDFKGKDADQVYYLLERPLSMVGFENFVFSLGIISTLVNYFANSNDAYSEYSSICTRIKAEIRQDQIDGGMAGIYNTSITQRLNNLVEQTDVTSKGEKINVVSLGNGSKPNE